MANPEHLQILQQGVEAWNQWRDQNRDITPDLNEAPLHGYPLSGASLRRASLRWADLRYTDLTGADLSQADLTRADLSGAVLHRASLHRAKLILANLTEADLAGADLSDVELRETVFGDTHLTAVLGLETCLHYGPSTLDHRTLARSGPLPLAFLRGCGLPEA